jgi:hypothetical protein
MKKRNRSAKKLSAKVGKRPVVRAQAPRLTHDERKPERNTAGANAIASVAGAITVTVSRGEYAVPSSTHIQVSSVHSATGYDMAVVVHDLGPAPPSRAADTTAASSVFWKIITLIPAGDHPIWELLGRFWDWLNC